VAGTGQLKRNNGIDLVTGGISDRGWNAIEEHSVSVVESTAQDRDDLAACEVEDGIERRCSGSKACGVECAVEGVGKGIDIIIALRIDGKEVALSLEGPSRNVE